MNDTAAKVAEEKGDLSMPTQSREQQIINLKAQIYDLIVTHQQFGMMIQQGEEELKKLQQEGR